MARLATLPCNLIGGSMAAEVVALLEAEEARRAVTEVVGACGHTRRAVVSSDPMQALREIEQLVNGDCAPCVRAARRAAGYAVGDRIFWPGTR